MYNPSIIKMQNILTNKCEDCKKRQKEITNEIIDLSLKLQQTDSITHKKYLELSLNAKLLNQKLDDLGIELKVWNEAITLCSMILEGYKVE